MELKIGKRIQDLRKQKGLTQEQVAAALNISAAAVSKWETDTTYPDITILNPLARLLGVSVDVLLDFQEQMTEEECMKRMEKADTLFSTRNWEEGQQYCEELLKEFPTDLFLKFRVASTYMQYAGASLQEEILKQQMERSITLFEESTASENAEISETAWYILSGLYCMNEEYEKGLEAVEKLPQPDFDARSMKSSILYQMGKLEESEKLTQRCLYEEIRNAGLERDIWQYFTCLPNIRSVGVMGDQRTYDYTVVIRAVTSIDGMTADWARIPYDVLDKISTRIVNEVKHVNRVAMDITSKPPGTIEWE